MIFAIATREMFRKFSDYKFGSMWVLFEPLMMMLFFMVMFGARGRGEFGFIEPPLFVLAAFLPFRGLFQGMVRETKSAPNVINGLSHLRQISLLDVMIARACMNFVVEMLVLIIISIGLIWLGYDPVPDHILETLFGFLLIALFGFGFGMVLLFLSTFAKEIDKFTAFINMPLLFTSAVFLPMSAIPEPYRTYLAYNPLVHVMEYIREMWFAHYTSPVVDMEYFTTWLVCMLGLALALYRLRWRKAVNK
ncbi:ABC transporter permease [Kordiimonas marina]|uniref:ABC transporter permease n=1 Tax=Kordiimonas marina TaxID=2872312 RepID=UPI001FF10BC7|nr:ABC transporter permease [Kordiimonas marina]